MKSVCLCGSFKFFDEMMKLEKFFLEKGIVCYKPSPFRYRNPQRPSSFVDAWFSLPFSEKLEESKRAELSHLEKIDTADVIYVINPSGYVGNSVILEIGYAYAKGKEVYSKEPVEDFAVRSLICKTISPGDLINVLQRDCLL